MSEQSKRCNTYDEMNQKIVGILRVGDNHPSLYAAQRIEELEEQLEQARTKNHNMWECPECGFAFDASHTDEGTEGQYSCPACAEMKLEKELEQSQQEIKRSKITKRLLIESHAENYEKACVRGIEIDRLNEQNQKLIEALEEIQGTLYGDVITRMRKMQGIADKALQEVQHGTSKET